MNKIFILTTIVSASAFADTINFSFAGTSSLTAALGGPAQGNSQVQTVASTFGSASVRNVAGTPGSAGLFTFQTGTRFGSVAGGNQIFNDGGFWQIVGSVYNGPLVTLGSTSTCNGILVNNLLACGTFITSPTNPSSRPNIQNLSGSNTLRSSVDATFVDPGLMAYLGMGIIIPNSVSMNLSRTGTLSGSVFGNGPSPQDTNGTLSIAASVPEPGSVTLMGLGAAFLLLGVRRRKR